MTVYSPHQSELMSTVTFISQRRCLSGSKTPHNSDALPAGQTIIRKAEAVAQIWFYCFLLQSAKQIDWIRNLITGKQEFVRKL